MKRKRLGIIGLLIGALAFLLMGSRITSNFLQLGRKAAEDIRIIFDAGRGAANPEIRWSESQGQLQFAHDGSTFLGIGSGAGSGEKNYIKNSTAANLDDVASSSPGSLVLSKTNLSGELPEGSVGSAFKIVASSSATNAYVTWSVKNDATDTVDRGLKLKAQLFWRPISGYEDGDYQLCVYDATAAVEAGCIDLTDRAGLYQTFYDTPTASENIQVRVKSTVGTSPGGAVSSVLLGPGNYATASGPGPARTENFSIGAVTTAPTPGSGATAKRTCWRNGEHLECQFEYQQSNAGSAGTGHYIFPIPSGLTIAPTYPGYPATGIASVGRGEGISGSTAFLINVLIYNSTHVYARGYNDASAFIVGGSADLSNATIRYSFNILVPISEWSGGAVLHTLSDPVVMSNYRARFRGTQGGGVNVGSTHDVRYTTLGYEQGAPAYDTATGIFTAPATQEYKIMARLSLSNISDTGSAILRITDASNNVLSTKSIPMTTGEGDLTDSLSLAKGDQIKVRVTTSGGGSPQPQLSTSTTENILTIEAVNRFSAGQPSKFGLAAADGAGLQRPILEKNDMTLGGWSSSTGGSISVSYLRAYAYQTPSGWRMKLNGGGQVSGMSGGTNLGSFNVGTGWKTKNISGMVQACACGHSTTTTSFNNQIGFSCGFGPNGTSLSWASAGSLQNDYFRFSCDIEIDDKPAW